MMTSELKKAAFFSVLLAGLLALATLIPSLVVGQTDEAADKTRTSSLDAPDSGALDEHDGRGRGDRERKWERRGGDGERDARRQRMRRMRRFLEFMTKFNSAVQDPYQATGFAALSIRKHYERAGKPLEAVPRLERMLTSTKDQRMRNVLLFHLRQIYEETQNEEKFLAINEQIMRENISLGGTSALPDLSERD